MTVAPRDLIVQRLRLEPVPLVPDIRLYTAHAGSGLSRLGRLTAAPYWAFPWPGGIALARYVLDRPRIVAGRRVLDLGGGSGLVAIAAAKAGAALVVAADIDVFATAATALNAAENGVEIEAILDDITTKASVPDVDVILGGDVFYASAVARRMTLYLDRCRDAGIEIVVGDPWRPDLPRDRLRRLATYPSRDVGEGRTATGSAAVFTYATSAAEKPGEEALLLRRRGRGRG